ncbi:hypothetical protein E5329_21020 [Petralouisia muris]|uniref:Uncharacterized protein n=1 Tax=Petralouisia muris TaxID=3032872 RepID=A0AC61RR31_9FIRM|nr:hypothetical protein [Petralouisia muris]MCI8860495.1 hypothetical protein [Lachnospiraceae bacterium]TGY91455.1 hypothetical protein E5329_21020 [Petralouisia muris]
MVELIEILFDSRVFMKVDAVIGFVLFGVFIYFYFSKEGRDERGRGILATATLVSYFVLFIALNIFPYFLSWMMLNIIRLVNGLQFMYNIILLSADIAFLILKKIR